jgi:hypothetical protein
VVGGGLWSTFRIRHATQRVAANHLLGGRPGAVQEIREVAVEVIKGGPGVNLGAPGTAFAGVPMAPGMTAPTGGWDPREVDALRQEGIDVSQLNEIRTAMRDALSDPNPQEQLRKTMVLKEKYGLNADPTLLGRLDELDARAHPQVSIADRTEHAWDTLVAAMAKLAHGGSQETRP